MSDTTGMVVARCAAFVLVIVAFAWCEVETRRSETERKRVDACEEIKDVVPRSDCLRRR